MSDTLREAINEALAANAAEHRLVMEDDVPTGWCECGKPYPCPERHVPDLVDLTSPETAEELAAALHVPDAPDDAPCACSVYPDCHEQEARFVLAAWRKARAE